MPGEWDEHTQEYFLHLFAKEQPDLNWESDAAREAIHNSAMRFWLEKGIDGFRVDTVNMYSKGKDLPDAPITDPGFYYQPASSIYCNGPRMHEFLREMNTKVLNNYDTMTVGELPYTPDPEHVLRYVSDADRQLSMVFQFDILELDFGVTHKYDYRQFNLSDFKALVTKWQKFIEGTDGWTTAFCENHDQGRSVSRWASDEPEWHVRSAKLLATMMTTLTGSLFIYQGQEIGMINAPKDWTIDEYQDIESVNFYKEVMERTKGDKDALDQTMKSIQMLGRDHPRLPMQWDDSPNAGFTSHPKPWMRVHDIYTDVNVKQQESDEDSILSYWKSMLKLRKQYKDLFIYGDFHVFEPENQETFIYTKIDKDDFALVALNFTQENQPFKGTMEKAVGGKKMKLSVCSYGPLEDGETLGPYEGRVYFAA
jgi:oligo-1,6-glucosidase